MRAGWIRPIAVVVWIAATCAAQAAPPREGDVHGAQSSMTINRNEFGSECGIQDTSSSAADQYSMEPDGEWLPGPSSAISETARIWHETNYMVDMHGAPGPGMSTMHSGLLCFDAQERLTRVFDRYMDVPRCGCQRLTTMVFAADGTMTEWAQIFADVRTGDHMKTPADAEEFPAVWEIHRMAQLPFYSLLKPNQDKPTGTTDDKR